MKSRTGRRSWTMELMRTGSRKCAPRAPPKQWGVALHDLPHGPEGMLEKERESRFNQSGQVIPTVLSGWVLSALHSGRAHSAYQPVAHPADQPGAQPVDQRDQPVSPWSCHQPPTLLCGPRLVPTTGESIQWGFCWGPEGRPQTAGGRGTVPNEDPREPGQGGEEDCWSPPEHFEGSAMEWPRPQAREDKWGPPARGDQERELTTGDQVRPSARVDQERETAKGDQERQSTREHQEREPARGDQEREPVRGDQKLSCSHNHSQGREGKHSHQDWSLAYLTWNSDLKP